MINPVIDKILGGAQIAITPLWNNGPKRAAGITYGTAQWAWNCIPDVKGAKTTIETTWKNSQHKTAIKTAAAVGAGALAAGATVLAAPLVITASAMTTGAAALTVGGGAVAATLMAAHPDHSILVNIPLRDPIELRTPGVGPGNPIDPTESLAAIAAKSVTFKENHPLTMSSQRLTPKPIDNYKRAKVLKEQQNKTDLEKDKFLENASAYSTAFFIFVNRLELPMVSANGEDILMEMTEAAVTRGLDGTKPNLWDACMGILEKKGIQLSTLQWIRAKFWYFLSDSIGIIPNTLNELGTRILAHLRGGAKGEQSKVSVQNILKTISSFLNKYNGAAQSYANAGQPGYPPLEGDLDHYRKKIIDQLGEESSLAKAVATLKPDENLGEKVMAELCKEFVATLVDDPEIFPSIPLFRGLQQISILGIRIGIFFDAMEWIFGGVINWVGKRFIKGYVPDIVQNIVQNGIDQAMPGKYSFKIGIANALKKQVEGLEKELAKGIPSTPLRFEENPLLNTTIKNLINTLELNACEGDQNALRRTLGEQAHPPAEKEVIRDHLQTAMLKGAQLLIHHYTKKPEALEQLFENLFTLSNATFIVGAPIKTEADFINASTSLDNSMERLIEAQVKEGVNEKVLGEKPEVLRTILLGKRIELLDKAGRPNPELDKLDANRNPLYPAAERHQRDLHGNLTYQLDAERNPIYKGLFYTQKEKMVMTGRVMKGLSLQMLKETHTDSVASLLAPPPMENPQAPDSVAIIEAKERLVAAQAKFNTAKTNFEGEERKKPFDEFEFMNKRNQFNTARIKLEIRQEELKVTQEIAKLEKLIVAAKATRNAAQGAALPIAQNKLTALERKRHFAQEELRLVRDMKTFNRLERPNDHPFKNLDNYMRVIDELAEYEKSLNIGLYDKMVQKIFYRAFGQIYQEIAALTEQVVDLQRLEKSYDKSKRLAVLFADIKDKIRQNPQNLLDLFRYNLMSLKGADEAFERYEANPADNITSFAVLIQQFEEISKEEKRIEGAILAKINTLGPPRQLSHQILKHPKKWVDDIRKKIPIEDQDPLFRSIATLQKNAALSPMPDLTANHAEVAARFSEIIQKYTNLRQEQTDQKNQKLQEIENWAVRRNEETEQKRNQTRDQLMRGFEKLKKDTDALATKIETVQPPPMHFPVHAGVHAIPGAPGVVEGFANEIVDKSTTLAKSAYNFITSREISEVSSRLALGELIRVHKKPEEKGFLARIWG